HGGRRGLRPRPPSVFTPPHPSDLRCPAGRGRPSERCRLFFSGGGGATPPPLLAIAEARPPGSRPPPQSDVDPYAPEHRSMGTRRALLVARPHPRKSDHREQRAPDRWRAPRRPPPERPCVDPRGPAPRRTYGSDFRGRSIDGWGRPDAGSRAVPV